MIGNYLHFSDAEFVDELYQEWLKNPESVDSSWNRYFQNIHNSTLDAALNGAHRAVGVAARAVGTAAKVAAPGLEAAKIADLNDRETAPRRLSNSAENDQSHIDKTSHAYKQSRVNAMIWAFRDVGYLYANLNPLDGYITPDLWYMMFSVEGNYEKLTPEEFGLSESDLDTVFLTGKFIPEETLPLREIMKRMQETYCGTLGTEILHIQNKAVRNWLINHLEGKRSHKKWRGEEKISFQKDLIKAEEFEHFIHSNFIGQKRFSLEGGEALIPALHYLFNLMVDNNVLETVLGMAHRGRLNVFANSMNRPAVDLFARFVDNYAPHTYGGSGDVKYHLGFSTDYQSENTENVLHIGLVANPSHLEAVNPVVEGKARGVQRRRHDRHRKKVIPVLIHGDSAFSGQGVVAETLNLSQLRGYRTGGTIHIIVNNQIGFTTASHDSRSTFFATDIAKSISVPIFHVNGDDPEAVSLAIHLAFEFRQKFGHDVIVDIICYRRLGHNEADEPSFSHPKMYKIIKNHQSARKLYEQRLIDEDIWSLEEQTAFKTSYIEELRKHLSEARKGYEPKIDDAYQSTVWKKFTRKYVFDHTDTRINREQLTHIAQKLVTIPEQFHVHSKLLRFTKGREKQFFTDDAIDWGFAESLAFGSLLMEGHAIRLSGEDCGRGTFSQRHAVWWDVESPVPKPWVPLRSLSPKQAWFSVYDSPLSEFSVLGFDYGYSLATPDNLTIWEGQFGDFVNGAQVIIDQFIVSAETKWFRSSGLTMLLPHGYEGQGPEHSSAFYERFLSLCADDNIQVVNATTPAQYFHVLRRQMKQEYRKPLIIMSPKSLLRHKKCVSSVNELSQGSFQTAIDDTLTPDKIGRVLICSGKIYYDLIAARHDRKDSAIVRLEQAYPFPADELKNILSRYTKAETFYWVQEETENRGAWLFVKYREKRFMPPKSTLTYLGRAASSSPATGSHKQHTEELKKFIERAFA
ncbi:MAG: 2-oxoglutarate dehydrogenase E1 component [Salinispira sp.]